jgi:hypothetical protein
VQVLCLLQQALETLKYTEGKLTADLYVDYTKEALTGNALLVLMLHYFFLDKRISNKDVALILGLQSQGAHTQITLPCCLNFNPTKKDSKLTKN